MNWTTLVDVPTLAAHLGEARLRIVDCRHDLNDPHAGRRAYAEAHIPGARFLHLDDNLSGACNGRNGRHPLPDPNEFAAHLGARGIQPGDQVVAYDAAGGAIAARLWWMLRWIGHSNVAVLDGGWPAWIAAGHPVESRIRESQSALYSARPAPATTLDAQGVHAALERAEIMLIDARSPDRFAGENETLDPVGGHIPGAANRFFRHNLTADGRFRPADELRSEFEALLGTHSASDVVHQCGSGVTACHNLLAMEIAGLSGARLYPGSWSEWCSDPTRPVATGND